MSYPNQQNLAAGALPVFVVPRPTWIGAPPNDSKDPQSAKAVYFCPAPGIGPYPNSQDDSGGAAPVYLAGSLGAGDGSDQGIPANAFPVWDAGGPPTKPFSNDPRDPNAAVPVWDISNP